MPIRRSFCRGPSRAHTHLQRVYPGLSLLITFPLHLSPSLFLPVQHPPSTPACLQINLLRSIPTAYWKTELWCLRELLGSLELWMDLLVLHTEAPIKKKTWYDTAETWSNLAVVYQFNYSKQCKVLHLNIKNYKLAPISLFTAAGSHFWQLSNQCHKWWENKVRMSKNQQYLCISCCKEIGWLLPPYALTVPARRREENSGVWQSQGYDTQLSRLYCAFALRAHFHSDIIQKWDFHSLCVFKANSHCTDKRQQTPTN